MSDEPTAPKRRWRTTRTKRNDLALEIGALHDGVAHRRDLREAGLTRFDVASEVAAGRWRTAGRHTVVIGSEMPPGKALLWRAVWESGSGAVLDGVSALMAAGLKNFDPDRIDVSIPANNRHRPVDGVRLHRRRVVGPVCWPGFRGCGRSSPRSARLNGPGPIARLL